MTELTHLRVYYAAAGIGFGASSYASALGGGPSWPNRTTWAVVALAAALLLIAYSMHHVERLRGLVVATVSVASLARMIGWLLTPHAALASRVGAFGTYTVIPSLMLVISVKARRGSP